MDTLGGWLSEIRFFYMRQLAFPLSPHGQALWHWLMWREQACGVLDFVLHKARGGYGTAWLPVIIRVLQKSGISYSLAGVLTAVYEAIAWGYAEELAEFDGCLNTSLLA